MLQSGSKRREKNNKIKHVSSFTHSISFSVYSLNRVGSCADVNFINASSFFKFIQILYNFFFVERPMEITGIPYSLQNVYPKLLSGTRWSARSDATRTPKETYVRVYSVQVCTAANKETVTLILWLTRWKNTYELAIWGIV
jgi:hypothetical protein